MTGDTITKALTELSPISEAEKIVSPYIEGDSRAPILFGDSPMLGVYVMPTVLNNKLDCL